MSFAPRVLDLFCGAGGMSLGFREAGCTILGGIEWEKWPAETHRLNFPECVVDSGPKDIKNIDPWDIGLKPGDVDILVGGPPCQGFSVVGQSKIRHLGLERERDQKNKLYKRYIEFLQYFRPLYFVIENVGGMKSFKKQKFLPEVQKELEGVGYIVQNQILTATDYGVPQSRHRLFIIGRRADHPELEIRFPSATVLKPVTVDEAISDLRRLHAKKLIAINCGVLGNSGARHIDRPITYQFDVPQNPYQKLMREKNGSHVMNHICRGHNEIDLGIFKKMKQGGKYIDLPDECKRYRDDIFKDKYRRLHGSQPAWTLTAHMQKDCLAFIHPHQTRSISAREAARLQSFPDRFLFAGPLTRVFRQIGNAVPPLMAKHVALVLVAELQKTEIPLNRRVSSGRG